MTFYTLFLAGLLGLFISSASLAKEYVPGGYNLDIRHSKVGFAIPYMKFVSVEGRFNQVTGSIILKDNFEESVVNVVAETASIDTGVDKRDDHLRSADFFHVDKYPVMTFKSEKIVGNKEHFKLIGNLTIRGITKRVEFDAHYIGLIATGLGEDKVIFSGKTKINRKDFGMNWNQIVESTEVIGHEVEIELKVLAAKPSKNSVKLIDDVFDISKSF